MGHKGYSSKNYPGGVERHLFFDPPPMEKIKKIHPHLEHVFSSKTPYLEKKNKS